MSNSQTNRSLERGIRLLKLIDHLGGCSLSALAREAELPKTTAKRLLDTLLEQKLVRKSLSDGLLRTNVILPLEHEFELPTYAWRLCDLAAPLMVNLVEQVRWPSDLFVRSGNAMQIVENSRANTPISIYHGKLSIQVDMLLSAAGRAYLAYCSDAERQRLIAENLPGNPCYSDPASVDRMLEATRRQGYAVRHPDYTGVSRPDDGLLAIAVPVKVEQQVLACINLVWVRDYMNEEAFAERYLTPLQNTAAAIAAAYSEVPTLE